MAWKHRLSGINLDSMTATCDYCGPNTRVTNTDRIRCWNGRQKGGTYGNHKLSYEEKVALFGTINQCPICLRELTYETAYLDHDHQTGELRGFLCGSCNLGLGKLGDTIAAIKRALEYLQQGNLRKDS